MTIGENRIALPRKQTAKKRWIRQLSCKYLLKLFMSSDPYLNACVGNDACVKTTFCEIFVWGSAAEDEAYEDDLGRHSGGREASGKSCDLDALRSQGCAPAVLKEGFRLF